MLGHLPLLTKERLGAGGAANQACQPLLLLNRLKFMVSLWRRIILGHDAMTPAPSHRVMWHSRFVMGLRPSAWHPVNGTLPIPQMSDEVRAIAPSGNADCCLDGYVNYDLKRRGYRSRVLMQSRLGWKNLSQRRIARCRQPNKLQGCVQYEVGCFHFCITMTAPIQLDLN